jgi:5-carboxymethyl-2-hydroxymuconate isomerase
MRDPFKGAYNGPAGIRARFMARQAWRGAKSRRDAYYLSLAAAKRVRKGRKRRENVSREIRGLVRGEIRMHQRYMLARDYNLGRKLNLLRTILDPRTVRHDVELRFAVYV